DQSVGFCVTATRDGALAGQIEKLPRPPHASALGPSPSRRRAAAGSRAILGTQRAALYLFSILEAMQSHTYDFEAKDLVRLVGFPLIPVIVFATTIHLAAMLH